jgi:tetratricopeptide (TPR) repeat protein
MPIKNILKSLTLAAVLFATAVLAQTPYDDGQKALRQQNWMEAAKQFEQAIKTDETQADAAMYWRAYALYKAGRSKEAERGLRQLERKYPESSWLKEAQALRIEYQDPEKSIEQVAGTGDGDAMDDELRLFALVQLMDRDPDRALPMVLDLARNAESPSVRQDALFVLAVNDSPHAKEALLEIVRNNDDPEMQNHAIHLLGTMDATEELQSIYATLENRATKVEVIHAFAIAGDSSLLKQVLEQETDPELRQAAIHGIAIEGGEESMQLLESLYSSTASTEEKAMILQAMAIGDDTAGIFRVLQLEEDSELRSAAIQSLAISDGEDVKDYLLELYPRASRDEKEAVIHSMMIMDDPDGLISLMKQEQDPELKREMMQMLATMDSEEADEYLFDMLENKG